MTEQIFSQPPRRGVVLRGAGGWLSGPCISPSPARADDIRPGDVAVVDGMPAIITAVDHGAHRVCGEWWRDAVAINWRAGTATGVLFRRAGDMVDTIRARVGRAE